MQSNLFRVAVAIVGGLSLSSAPLVAAPAAADQPAVPRGSCTCRVIGGGVFFQSMSVSPDPSPAGERLVLSFDLTAFVYSGPNFQSLTDSAGLLEVVEVVRPFGSPVVAVRASAPGATEVSVTVSYGTEEECTCADGSMFFQIGPTRTETSRGFPLAVTSPGAPTPTPTPTVVPTPTATSIVGEPPTVDDVTSPTTACTQVLQGQARALSRGGSVYVVGAATHGPPHVSGLTRFRITVDLEPNATHELSVCQVVPTGGPATCAPVTIEQVLAGDCGRDGATTVDEIVTAITVALGEAEVSRCDNADPGRDGSVTVDEILLAISAALSGCPLGLPDLVPSGLVPVGPNLGYLACVTNDGDAEANDVDVRVIEVEPREIRVLTVASLGPADTACELVGLVAGQVDVIVDPNDAIAESEEGNNEATYSVGGALEEPPR